MKRTDVVALLLGLVLVPGVSMAKEGAKAQAVDQDGHPIGEVHSLPDCHSCGGKEVGKDHYEVHVPASVHEKISAAERRGR